MEARYIKHTKKSKNISPTRQIAFSFLMVILIGSLLLWLPFSNKSKVPYLDHLFVATSATCVTGLVPVVVKEQYTLIGQLIIITLFGSKLENIISNIKKNLKFLTLKNTLLPLRSILRSY